MHDYFYGAQAAQYSFFRVPTLLFMDDQYKTVSPEAKILYGMYHDLDEWSAYDFSQFFIDHRFQRKGYGLKAAELILEKLKADGKYDKVVLCYIDGDDAAKNLYEKLGFHHTGEADGNEIIMEMLLR